MLSRMIGTYYWIGLNIYKQAQSLIRSVVCCSGCLAAYRAPLLREIIGEFAGQRFLGEACTRSEDRHLTNLVLKRGYDVVYVAEAVSWTETPATVQGFLRQQRRWKRGYVARVAVHAPLRVADEEAALPAVIIVVMNPIVFLTAILPSWIVLLVIRYIFVPLRARDKLPGLFLYMFFYELCLS